MDGRVLPVHWFQGSVDAKAYLEMLKEVVWPAIRGRATRREYWFQQDGASPHCTPEVLAFLSSKFGDRVISRRTEHFWPPYSPDLNPLDFSFWALVNKKMWEQEKDWPKSKCETRKEFLARLRHTAMTMPSEYITKIVGALARRCGQVVEAKGGHFAEGGSA